VIIVFQEEEIIVCNTKPLPNGINYKTGKNNSQKGGLSADLILLTVPGVMNPFSSASVIMLYPILYKHKHISIQKKS
jgi:hypothetical protein